MAVVVEVVEPLAAVAAVQKRKVGFDAEVPPAKAAAARVVGRVTWVGVCGSVWGIGLRRLGCGCGRRFVTGSCVIRETNPKGSSAPGYLIFNLI